MNNAIDISDRAASPALQSCHLPSIGPVVLELRMLLLLFLKKKKGTDVVIGVLLQSYPLMSHIIFYFFIS